jgi:hypothetical protein
VSYHQTYICLSHLSVFILDIQIELKASQTGKASAHGSIILRLKIDLPPLSLNSLVAAGSAMTTADLTRIGIVAHANEVDLILGTGWGSLLQSLNTISSVATAIAEVSKPSEIPFESSSLRY